MAHLLVLRTEVVLDHLKDVCILGEIDELTELADAQGTLDLLLGVGLVAGELNECLLETSVSWVTHDYERQAESRVL